MRKALIAVQAEQFSDAQIQTLDRLIHAHYEQHVSDEALLTIWNQLPKGQAFTDYKDSQSSMITLECPNGFAQEKRVRVLTALESDWRATTGQNPHEVMLALVEQDLFGTLFASNQQRLSWMGRLNLIVKMIKSIVRARLSGSPVSFNPNL